MDGRIIEVDLANNRLCANCGKRIATKLCDAPLGRIRYVGHFPRYLSESRPWEHLTGETVTCDKTLCEKCAKDMGNGIDFCPTCAKRLRFA